MNHKDILIIAAHGTDQIASSLSQLLHLKWYPVQYSEFPNEESRIKISHSASTIILIGSLAKPVNTRIIEYLLAADALKRMGCQRLIGIISWFAYSKQDKVFLPGEPLSSKVIATLLQSVSLKELITLDLHNPSIAGYFEIPVSNAITTPLFVDLLKTTDLSNTIVVSPDAGSIKNSTKFADHLNLPICFASKSRNLVTGEVSFSSINQDISGKNILICDDMIATGATLIQAAEFLKSHGAEQITVCCTHHLYLPGVQAKLDQSPIDRIIVTNSIAKPDEITSPKLTVIDVSPVFVDKLRMVK